MTISGMKAAIANNWNSLGRRSHWAHTLFVVAVMGIGYRLAPLTTPGDGIYRPLSQLPDPHADALLALNPWAVLFFGYTLLGGYLVGLWTDMVFLREPLPPGQFAQSNKQVLLMTGGFLIGVAILAGFLFAVLSTSDQSWLPYLEGFKTMTKAVAVGGVPLGGLAVFKAISLEPPAGKANTPGWI